MADKTLPQSGIYAIRNTVSGRIYVGSAINIRQRWRAHRSLLGKGKHHSVTLQRSWIKHGEGVFSFDILEVVTEKASLLSREQNWIDTLNAACPKRGFNNYAIAGSPLGSKRTPEQRAALSALRLGKKRPPFTPEHRAAISKGRLGLKPGKQKVQRTAEHCAKIGASKLGKKRVLSQELLDQMRDRTIARNRTSKMRAVTAENNRRRRRGDLSGQLAFDF